MPRPDKRFIRYPRQGSPTDSEAEESDAAATPAPRSFVKGRHMVVPRPADPTPVAENPVPKVTPRRPIPGELVTKYDARPTSGAVPVPERPVVDTPVVEAPEVVEPAASAAPEPEAVEVVFDLRESDAGFEATYWKKEVDQPASDRDHR